MLTLAVVLALVWGGVWAVILQFTDWGRFAAMRRTWLTVVIGVGIDLLILLVLLSLDVWLIVLAVIGASSVGIIGRSLANEYREHRELLQALGDRDVHQDAAR